jgi:hypothetical protein
MKNKTELCLLFEKYGADKCSTILHSYSSEYYRLLNPIKKKVNCLIEIGIGTETLMRPIVGENYIPGASLRAWSGFFPNAQIIGLDIESSVFFETEKIKCFYMDQSLSESINDTVKTLKNLNKEGRLFWYNHLKKNRLLTIKNIKRVLYKDIDVRYFSAEAALSILAQNNIKDVYSVGIDGGSSYSNNFSTETLLANGRSSFDAQFEEMVKTIKNYHVVYSPVNASYPIRVYVGSQEEQMLCVKVLEYSIKKHTKADVEVIPMHKSGINYGIPKDPKNRQRTPFSFQRFLIPQLNNYKGRAIYVDSDMQVFQDIRQLYNLPMGSCDLLTVENRNQNNRKLQFSVMLLDCEKLKWNINDIIYKLDNEDLTYDSLMKEMKVANNMAVRIPYYWNCLEWYKKSESALVHYTDMDKQPWVKTNNKLCDIWLKDLIMAIKDGFISINYIKEHIEKGWVRPSLLWQIENNYLDSTKLSKKVLKLDEKYKAPYEFMEIVKS